MTSVKQIINKKMAMPKAKTKKERKAAGRNVKQIINKKMAKALAKEKTKAKTKKERKAAGRNLDRRCTKVVNRVVIQYNRDAYHYKSARALASHYRELGKKIFAHRKHTESGKILYANVSTGWQICFDPIADYSTVQDANGLYVALDGTTSKSGKDEKFHFRNS